MLFTIVLEFEGTTSVSQFSGRNVAEAYRRWFQGLDDPGRYGLDSNQVQRLTSALSAEPLQPPTPLAATENVWCTTTLVGGELALLNFVATVAAVGHPKTRITTVTTSNEQVTRKHSQTSRQINRLPASVTERSPSGERKSRKPRGDNRLPSGSAV